jgi:hypothetical protein
MTDNNSIQDKLNNDNNNIIPEENNSNTGNIRKYNIQNLKPYNKTDNILTSEEAKRRGRNGAKKSAEVRRQRKTMKDTILDLIQKEVSTEQYGGDSSILGDKATLQEIILASMIREASNGDTKAMQLLRDTIGEQPVNRQEITQEVITKDDTELMDSLKKSLIS